MDIASPVPENFYTRVRLAVLAHPDLAGAEARLASAAAARDGAQGAFQPRLSVGAMLGGDTASDAAFSVEPQLTLQQLVYDGGAARARVAAADADLSNRDRDRLAVASDLAFRAVSAWIELRHENRRAELALQNLDLHHDLVARTEMRVTSGTATDSELLAARARLANASAREVEARTAAARARAVFAEFFGDVPAGDMPGAPVPAAATPDAVLADSPRLAVADAAVAAAEARAAVARAGGWPRLSLGVSARPGDDRVDLQGGLSLSYDVATGGQLRAAVREADAQVALAIAERDALRRDILRAADFLQADRAAGAERVAAARAAVAANEADAAAATAQFEIGRRTIAEVLQTQSDLLEASETLLEAERQRELDAWSYLALTGGILSVFALTPEGGT